MPAMEALILAKSSLQIPAADDIGLKMKNPPTITIITLISPVRNAFTAILVDHLPKLQLISIRGMAIGTDIFPAQLQIFMELLFNIPIFPIIKPMQ
jgi:hypothetical protein